MKNNINETLIKYTAGEINLEAANAALEGTGFHLDPLKNVLTEEEMRATTIGYYPDQANGFGMLDTGTGTMNKVQVKDGRLVDCDMGSSYAAVYIAGHKYEIKGTELVEPSAKEEPEAPDLPERPVMSRRADLAGQTVRQHTRHGDYNVTYNEFGYASKAVRVES